MQPSLYAEATMEKYGHNVYEDERGFFSYSISEKYLCIEEFFISKNHRSALAGRRFVQIMVDLATQLNCIGIFISIFMNVKNDLRDITLILAMRNGFRLSHCSPSHIFLKRGL